jgi:P pilus assembly chaperone PapD
MFVNDTEYVLLDDQNCNGVVDGGEKQLGPYKLPGSAEVSYFAPGSTVTFSASGMLANPSQQVALQLTNAKGTTKGITVWASGSIDMHSS